jgi:hypothetical protein
MAVESKVERYLARYKDLETEKTLWLPLYQALAEAFLSRKADFTTTITPGDFLLEKFDNTGQFAAQTAASIFLSMLWPDSSRTFAIRPVRRLKDVPGVEAYFRFVTDEVRTVMDNPRAGLTLAYMEHFLEQQIFGTSGVGTFEGPAGDASLPVVYDAWGIKNMCVIENAQGFIDVIYFKRPRTVRQIVQEYGEKDKVSQKILDLYDEGKYNEKYEVLQIVEPKAAEPNKKGVAAMAYRTVHIDIKHKLVMRESGYQEMPVAVGRMIKLLDEPYARSPAMTALPDANSLDALSEAILVAAEKQLDPPLMLLDDGRLGGGVVDTSSGGLNVFNSAGRLGGEKPLQPIFTVGEMVSAEKLKEQLEKKIMQAFSLDRLLDLNNTVQMTAYETSVRDRMRGQSLGSLFARQIVEVLTPTIERTFNILYRGGHLGVVTTGVFGRVQQLWNKILGRQEMLVPPSVVAAAQFGLDVFEIEYISPAQRFMQGEKLQGVLTVADMIVLIGQLVPGLIDNFDSDKMAEYVVKYGGAPGDVKRTVDEVTKLRAGMAAQQAAATKLEATKQMSEVGRNTAQAVASLNSNAGGKGK